jgi:hypothetical protein
LFVKEIGWQLEIKGEYFWAVEKGPRMRGRALEERFNKVMQLAGRSEDFLSCHTYLFL